MPRTPSVLQLTHIHRIMCTHIPYQKRYTHCHLMLLTAVGRPRGEGVKADSRTDMSEWGKGVGGSQAQEPQYNSFPFQNRYGSILILLLLLPFGRGERWLEGGRHTFFSLSLCRI